MLGWTVATYSMRDKERRNAAPFEKTRTRWSMQARDRKDHSRNNEIEREDCCIASGRINIQRHHHPTLPAPPEIPVPKTTSDH
jgi:hypothetical protein